MSNHNSSPEQMMHSASKDCGGREVMTYTLFASVSLGTTVVLSALFLFMRNGLLDPMLYSVCKVWLLLIWILCLPVLLHKLNQFLYRKPNSFWFPGMSAGSLYAIGSVLLVGYVGNQLGFNPVPALGVLSCLSALFCFYEIMHNRPKWRDIGFGFGGGVLLGLIVAGFVWGSGYYSPDILERLVEGAYVREDSFFHAAIAQMIRSYGTPSVGIAGLVPIQYHWGSHWIFAQTSAALNMSVIETYQLVEPLVYCALLPLFMLQFGNALSQRFVGGTGMVDTKGFRQVLFLLVPCYGGMIVPIPSPRVLAGSAFGSESFLLAITFAFLGATYIVELFVARSGKRMSFPFLSLLLIPILIGGLILLKVSVGILFALVYGYIFVRLKLFRQGWHWLLALLSLGIALLALAEVHSGGARISPFFFWDRCWKDQNWKAYVPYLTWFWSVFAYFVVISRSKWRNKNGPDSAKIRVSLWIEILVLISIASFIPGEVLAIGGCSGWYFSDVQRWSSFAILAAFLFVQPLALGIPNRFKIILFTLVGVPFLWTVVPLPLSGLDKVVKSFSQQQSESRKPISMLFRMDLFRLAYSLTDTLPLVEKKNKERRSKLESNVLYQRLNQLTRIESAGHKKKGSRIVLKDSYYYMVKDVPGHRIMGQVGCIGVPFIIPALTGIAVLNGLPEVECTRDTWLVQAGFYGYQAYLQELGFNQFKPKYWNPDVCAKAAAGEFQSLLIVKDLKAEHYSATEYCASHKVEVIKKKVPDIEALKVEEKQFSGHWGRGLRVSFERPETCYMDLDQRKMVSGQMQWKRISSALGSGKKYLDLHGSFVSGNTDRNQAPGEYHLRARCRFGEWSSPWAVTSITLGDLE